MTYRNTVLATLIAVLVLSLVPLPSLAAPPLQGECPGNLLVNAGFEEGFSTRGAGEVEVANGWDPWWVNGSSAETADGFLRRPEYKPENAQVFGMRRVHAGVFSQKWFTTFSTHEGGILQQVSVPVGSEATFSSWVQVWSSQDPNPDTVVQPGNYRVSVGIDPTGGADGRSPNVVWSQEVMEYNTWLHLSVTAKAQAGTITVFLRGRPEYRTQFNDSYWDDACLTIVRPTPLATNTPRPTSTPVDTPTPTSTPTLTPTPTPVVGSISMLAYQDDNGNSRREEGEALIPGVDLRLRRSDSGVSQKYTTDGVNEPKTFGHLTTADYILSAEFPSAYVPTGPTAWGVSLGPGAAFTIEFGARYAPTATPTRTVIPTRTPTPTPTPQPAGSVVGSTLYAISGLLTLALAIGLGVWVYLRRKQPQES